MEPTTILAAAALQLAFDRPYLGTALYALQRVSRPGLGTMAVDRRWRLYFDPETIVAWGVAKTGGVVYHELCHLLREHADRAPIGGDPFLWNVAGDAEINDDLESEEVKLPGHPAYPRTIGQPDGRLAEEYYAAIAKTADTRDRRASSRPLGDCQEGSGPFPGFSLNGASAGRAVVVEDPELIRPSLLGYGSGASGNEDVQGHETTAGLALPPGLAAAEAIVLRRQVAVAIREHARTPGRVSGHWARWAEAKLEPRVDWRHELAAAVRSAIGSVAGASDYSYTRPSRRQPCFDRIVVPSLRQPVPRVAVVVDTSGSVDDDLLAQGLAEVASILRSVGQRDGLWVLAVDAAVQAWQSFSPMDIRRGHRGHPAVSTPSSP
jgi:predicted metal-dependent peptidase